MTSRSHPIKRLEREQRNRLLSKSQQRRTSTLTSEECVWTRLADIQQPLETHPVRFKAGCTADIGGGVHPFYPDNCPVCKRPVRVDLTDRPLTPGTKPTGSSNQNDTRTLLREARDALDGIASERDDVRWDLATRIEAFLKHTPETSDDARWIREAKGTLDKLYGFLQAKNVPYAVDTRDWIDNALRVLDAYKPHALKAEPALHAERCTCTTCIQNRWLAGNGGER